MTSRRRLRTREHQYASVPRDWCVDCVCAMRTCVLRPCRFVFRFSKRATADERSDRFFFFLFRKGRPSCSLEYQAFSLMKFCREKNPKHYLIIFSVFDVKYPRACHISDSCQIYDIALQFFTSVIRVFSCTLRVQRYSLEFPFAGVESYCSQQVCKC